VGYVGGKSNPLNKITFYNLKNGKIISENKVRSFSLLITQKHQEYFLRVYCTDLDIVKKFNDYFDNIYNNSASKKPEKEKQLEETTNLSDEKEIVV
jgi:hypothetical protein